MEELTGLRLHESWNSEASAYLRQKLQTLKLGSRYTELLCAEELKTELAGTSCIISTTSGNSISMTIGVGRNPRRYRFIGFCLFGMLGEKVIVRHKCKTPFCYNPLHLSVGDQKANHADRLRDGTDTRGSRHYNTALTEDIVREIFAEGKTLSINRRMEKYGVSWNTIRFIDIGKTWNHVTGLPKHIRKNIPKNIILEELLADPSEIIRVSQLLANKCLADEKGCWIYQGKKIKDKSTGKETYGQFSYRDKVFFAHCLSWMLKNKTIKPTNRKTSVIRHLCNNTLCCNPEHLMFGTQKQNMLDVDRKGEKSSKAKMTEKQIMEIMTKLQQKIPQFKIAEEYGLSKSYISALFTGRTWKHITQSPIHNPSFKLKVNATVA